MGSRATTKEVMAIVKRPDERFGQMMHISIELEDLQKMLCGYIEAIPHPGKDDCVILCNEDGKLQRLPFNMWIPGDYLVGTVIVLGIDGEDFAPVPIEFSEWKEWVKKWESEGGQ